MPVRPFISASEQVMPMEGRQLFPVAKIRLTKGRMSDMGRASPRFSMMTEFSTASPFSRSRPEILALVMPTTCPCSLRSAPPELPGLRAAEV